MHILQLHNTYRAGPGGEDTVLENERRLLESRGHVVDQRMVETSADRVSGLELLRTARNSVYSSDSRSLVREWVREVRPDVVHVHNTFPILSPSVFHELHATGVPTVLTLHNYRLACANALFLRDGKPCEDCLGGSPWQAVRHRCYRGSLAGSVIQAGTRVVHDGLGTFQKKVDAMIVLSDFAKDVFTRFGIPAERLHVKPNFVAAGARRAVEKRRTFVFVGKVVPEKGLGQLLEAWSALAPLGWELKIVGDGPERVGLEERFAGLSGVSWLGWKGQDEVRGLVAEASWLVLPSVWYEGFPMALLEGFAEGTPAIVPQLGAMPEIVGQGARGIVYDGTVTGLRYALVRALEMPEAERDALQDGARRAIDGVYSADANAIRLEGIYETAIERVETRTFPAKGSARTSRTPSRAVIALQTNGPSADEIETSLSRKD